jgi:hypothetical protein
MKYAIATCALAAVFAGCNSAGWQMAPSVRALQTGVGADGGPFSATFSGTTGYSSCSPSRGGIFYPTGNGNATFP